MTVRKAEINAISSNQNFKNVSKINSIPLKEKSIEKVLQRRDSTELPNCNRLEVIREKGGMQSQRKERPKRQSPLKPEIIKGKNKNLNHQCENGNS